MKRTITSLFTTAILLLIGYSNIYAQNTPTTTQDSKLQTIMKLKEQLEKENNLYNGYTVQLHNGNLERAQERKKKYIEADYTWPVSIHYETPNYKLWAGNFDTRLDADRALLILKEKFPSAFILRPDRK